MTTFKHLLVTTDFSQEAAAGIRTARDLAGQLSARISLVHVREELLPSMMFSTEAQREELRQASLRLAQKQLAACAREHFENVPVETHLLEGTAHAEIIGHAGEIGADLIVMATQGRGSLGQLVFGSTTQRVIQLSPVPVVAVRPPAAS